MKGNNYTLSAPNLAFLSWEEAYIFGLVLLKESLSLDYGQIFVYGQIIYLNEFTS